MSFICSLRDKLVVCVRATGFVSPNQPQRAICRTKLIKARARTARDLGGSKKQQISEILPVESIAACPSERDKGCLLTNCVSRLVTILGRNPSVRKGVFLTARRRGQLVRRH